MIQKAEMFKKIKSLFVVEETGTDTASNQENTIIESKNEASNSSGSQNSDLQAPVSTFDGKPDPRFTDRLLRPIESNNME